MINDNQSRFSNQTEANRKSVSHGNFFTAFWIRCLTGAERIKRNPKLLLIHGVYLVLVIYMVFFWRTFFAPTASDILISIFKWLFVGFALVLLVFMHFCMGYPIKNLIYRNGLLRAGVINQKQEAPILYDFIRHGQMLTITFEVRGIPLHIWRDKIPEIQSALNIRIGSIEEINPRKIAIEATNGKTSLPKLIKWDESFLSKNESVLTMGQGYTNCVSIDLSVMPHLLVAGGTGSGKTILLLSLIYQALLHGADIIIADLKRGGDYPRPIREQSKMCYSLEKVLDALEKSHNEMERRYDLNRENDCKSISEYNAKFKQNLKRTIIVVDEMAELLDRTGRTKEEKALIEKIESRLCAIARLGRAANINLFLSMQRPDANVLNGQIKNNVQARVCGRADNTLSILVMDDARAEEQIPKNEQGLFINNENVIFRGFWHDKFDFNNEESQRKENSHEQA